ncbi:HlyD family efflux transporter periplasmic adaptor subunit [Cyanobium sp. Candia 9D4]|uniref:HlyD family efflux transporter periplasmic adaptor subunit n=1 Tax=Cyanobium sp. Candia 9D4 TaxID=2823707 RepID=UPI0020CD58D2|nr:HlyD family efflux transporter periplasmic adaptor subunit [Cyanobium sp. Candia 9D4]MCP9934268.1 HlyD family efflux transporter periplasmic adaptor subunit [Cyanobium sp. Candia 9D4]
MVGRRARLGLVAAGGAGLLALGVGLLRRATPPPPPPVVERPVRTVTALGRLEPVSALRTIAAPLSGAGQPTLQALLVDRGDAVQAGQLLALLDNQPQLEAAVAAARAEVNLARSRLAIASADAGSGEDGQRAKVRSLEAQQRTAATEAARYQSLFTSGAVSAEERDNRRLSLDTVTASLQEARVLLARQQARSSAGTGGVDLDVEASRRVLEQAQANLQRAIAARDDNLIRAPIAGTVLQVFARAGEAPGAAGILQLGQTSRMQAVAEVYESDLPRVRRGQPVRITSPALTQPLQGRVGQIGAIVLRQNLINTDPSSNTDNRVVEVRAPLTPESSRRAAGFTNLQVRVVIGP